MKYDEVVHVKADLLRKAQTAYADFTPGHVELNGREIVGAALRCLINEAEGRLLSPAAVQEKVNHGIAHGIMQAYTALGHRVSGVSLTPDGFVVHVPDDEGSEIEIPQVFKSAFNED